MRGTIQIEVDKKQLSVIIQAVEIANTLARLNAKDIDATECELFNADEFLKNLKAGLDLFE